MLYPLGTNIPAGDSQIVGVKTYESRDAWNQELANLEKALASGDLAYGGADAAIQDLYTRLGAPANISYQEAQGVIGDMYNKYFPPLTQAETGAYTPTQTTGTDTTALNKAIADLEAQKANIISQFEPLYAKYLADLNESLTRNKGDLDKGYWDNANLNDQRYGEGLQNIQRGYAARGIGDSSYKENAIEGLGSEFKRIYGDLTSQKDRGEGDLQKQYNEKLANAQALRNNFYNPDQPQYTDVSQVASASAGLNSQLETAKTNLANANLSNSTSLSNPAASDRLFQEYAASQVEAGTPWGTVANTLKQRGQTDPSYDAYLSYLYGSKEGDNYKYLNPQKAKYLY